MISTFSLAAVASLALAQAAGAPATRLPAAPAGCKLELVAAAPRLKHPSVVCCAPDGRVFVAEDPMDISLPRADAASGRILCLHPDGRLDVFAEGLYAVFGMQYLWGKLYVLHNPRFSVFTDSGGAGADRMDILESTHPEPWALDWNDHVPANFRLGMDGFFYVAVGDKGLYGCVGRDGKRLDLRGGGILRLRPDGTGLEVYCTGVRNILDVALNEEDELFTYDNTDEQQWMGRLTHMVDGGTYGYPYDFIPRRPYTLWMMADYGAGAATGTASGDEEPMPEEYRRDLFLADFGKRNVLRVKVEREGATYRAVSRADLFVDPPEDFRPVGIALSPDGLSLYICDWNHADNKDVVVVGRLWKLTFAGVPTSASKPAWWLPAGLGRAIQASIDELLAALEHPSRSVRLTAQRGLVERGPEARPALARLLGDRGASPRARRHALWALAAGGELKEILAAADDPDPSLRRQALRCLGGRRAAEGLATARGRLRDPEPSVRFWAAAALGRIEDDGAVPALLDALEEDDAVARFAVFTALHRIGRARPAAWEAIARGLESRSPRVREASMFALRETFDAGLARLLSRLARDHGRSPDAREAAARLLAPLHRKIPEWKGEWWAYHPVNAPPPEKKVDWEGTPVVLETLDALLDEEEPRVRLAGVEGLAVARHREGAPRLRALFERERDASLRRAIVAALGELKDEGSAGLLASLLTQPGVEPAMLEQAIAAARRIPSPDLVPSLARHAAGADEKLCVPAVEALAAIPGKPAAEALAAALDHPRVEVRRAAIQALGGRGDRDAIPRLLGMLRDAETQQDALLALARIPDMRSLDAYLEAAASKDAALRAAAGKAIAALGSEALPKVEALAESLPAVAIAELQKALGKLPEARRGPLFARAAKPREASEYRAFAAEARGNPERGRLLFQDPKGLNCLRCHVVMGQGRAVGPDLSGVGSQFTREKLIESVLFPSQNLREGYETVLVITRDRGPVQGLFRGETTDEVRLLDAEGKLETIPKSRIADRQKTSTSLMPEGLQSALSFEEFADLISYLETLKQSAPPAPAPPPPTPPRGNGASEPRAR